LPLFVISITSLQSNNNHNEM